MRWWYMASCRMISASFSHLMYVSCCLLVSVCGGVADYVKAKFPYLLVRFEDLIYHPKHVVQTVCQCAGGELNHGDFHYVTDSAKKGDAAHGKVKTGYLDALIRYGHKEGRTAGMEEADLQYARDHLDARLMELFQYPYDDV